MFKLVGKETFNVGKSDTKATINIDAVSGFAYEYTLEINGKSLKKYMENRSKVTSTWVLNLDGTDCRVVLGKPCCPPIFEASVSIIRPRVFFGCLAKFCTPRPSLEKHPLILCWS